MNSQIFKDVRRVFWPWCLMILAGLAPLIKSVLADKRSDWPEGIAVFGFFGGAAILTARLFRHTSQTRLSAKENVDACGSWSVKMTVLTITVVFAGLLACVVQSAVGEIKWRELNENAIEPLLLLVIIVCSTGFWTLLTRSIIGGLLLTGVAQFMLYLLLVLFATAIDHLAPANPGGLRLSHEPEVHAALSWFVGGFGLSYAAIMLWLSRRKFARTQQSDDRPDQGWVTSFIRSLSPVTEFCVVIFVCFGLTIFVASVWIIRHLTHTPPVPFNEIVHLRNDGVALSVITELIQLAIVLWIGRIRGWSLATFGLRFSWKWTGVGALIFFAFLLIQQVNDWVTQGVFRSAVDFHRTSHLALPFIILISMVNPLAEEAIECGYIFHALQRHGMWVTIFAAATFRGYLHATMGVSGFVDMFAMGLLYGFVYWRWRQLWPLIVAHALQMFYALIPQGLAK